MSKTKLFEIRKFKPIDGRYPDLTAFVVRFDNCKYGAYADVGISEDGKGSYFHISNNKKEKKFLKDFIKALKKASDLLEKTPKKKRS